MAAAYIWSTVSFRCCRTGCRTGSVRLNPQVDRLDDVLRDGIRLRTLKRVSHDIFTSVIRTKERMTYTNVRKILTDEGSGSYGALRDLVDTFKLMEELAMRLRSQTDEARGD